MNLFYSPSLTQLSTLIAFNNDYNNYYDVIVEHDGEVLLQQSLERKSELLHKYRFYFKDFLYGQSCLGREASRNLQFLNQLYKNLVYCWENNLLGSVNFNDITRVLNRDYRVMVNAAARESSKTYAPYFRTRSRSLNFPQLYFYK